MATIIVEDGSGVPNANSYVSVAELQQYADDRGIELVGDLSQLIINAMDYIESLNYKGVKKDKNQSLKWPRKYVIIDGYSGCGCSYFPDDEIPSLLKKALMATAVAVDQGNSPLAVVDRAVKREQVDVISVEYMDNASSSIIDPTINAALAPLLDGFGGSSLQFKVGKA